jgi:predicted PurR-regulated permease PerM
VLPRAVPRTDGHAQLPLTVLAAIAAQHWARDFLIPLITAAFLAYTLHPLVNRLAGMNPTAIFVALLFFGWLWGAWGLLLGIPVAVICKVIAECFDRLALVAELLSD